MACVEHIPPYLSSTNNTKYKYILKFLRNLFLIMAVAIKVHDHPTKDLEEQIKREALHGNVGKDKIEAEKKKLPSPLKAAAASALMFAVGAIVPLLAAAFVMDYHVRLMVVIGSVSFALIGFGGLSAILGKAPVIKSISRVLIGGWLAMGITFGLTKLVGSTGL